MDRRVLDQCVATVEGKEVVIKIPFCEPLIAAIKATGVANPPHFGFKKDKRWHLNGSLEAVKFLNDLKIPMAKEERIKLRDLVTELLREKAIIKEKNRLWNSLSEPPIPELQKKLDACQFHAMPHQWAPAHYAKLCNGSFILGDDMSVGKCSQSVMITMMDEFEDHPVLVVTPVPEDFQEQLYELFGFNSFVIDKPLQKLIKGVRYYLVPYNKLNNVPKDIDWFFIFDEAHNIKNWQAQRTKDARKLVKGKDHVLLMSGTIIQNRTNEMYVPLDMVMPGRFEWHSFMQRYCGAYHSDHGYDTRGASNIGELHKIMKDNCYMRREFKDVSKGMPPLTRHTYEMDQKIVQASSMLEMYAQNALFKACDQTYVDWLIQKIKATNGKVIVFAHHQAMLDGLSMVFANAGIEFIRMDGKIGREERFKKVKEFRDSPTIKVGLLSISTSGTGLNLQFASDIIFAELCWVPGELMQAERRVWRFGQKNPVNIHMPLFTKFDNLLYKLIIKKMSIIGQVQKGRKSGTTNSDIIDELCKMMGLPKNNKKTA